MPSQEEHLAFAPDIDLRKFIQQDFESRKAKNKRYSLRAHAQKLGISHAAISQIMNGNRALTKRTIGKIVERLRLDGGNREKVWSAHEKDPRHSRKVDRAELERMPFWYRDVLLEMLLLEDFQEDCAWIAKRLRVDEETCAISMKAMIEHGMIVRGTDGKLHPGNYRTTTVGMTEAATLINEVRTQFLAKEIEATQELRNEERSSLGLTIAMNPDDLPQARQIIFKFVNELAEFLNRGDVERREVFRLNVGLFPIARPKKSEEN